MPTSSMTKNGQVTIPKPVRDHLRLSPGDRVEFLVDPDGSVRVRRVSRSALALYGILRAAGKRLSVEEMDRSVREGRSRDDARIRRNR